MINKIKIAFFIDTIARDTAGTERQLIEMIKRIDLNHFVPHIICLRKSEWMNNNILPCDVSVLGYKGFLKFSFPIVLFRLKKIIQYKKFDIIQTFFEESIFVCYLGSLLSRHRPVLLSSRRDIGLGTKNKPFYHRFYKFILPYINSRFDGIIANSEQVKKLVSIKEKTPLKKIIVIHNGIDIPSDIINIKPEIIRNVVCDIWICIVANLKPVKRHDLFLNAFSIIKNNLPHYCIKALVIGDGPEKNNLIDMTKKLNIFSDVFFAGEVNNVYDYLKYMHIGINCSDREGLSNAIMEYMASSLPVIATNVGGNVELVNKLNGICVSADNVHEISNAIRILVENSDLRNCLGKHSLDKIKNGFSWSKTMKLSEMYYKKISEK